MPDLAGRRVRIVPISSHLLLQWLHEGTPAAVVIEGALPGDAAIVDVSYEDLGGNCGTINVLVESGEWEAIPAGGTVPRHDIHFRTLNPAYAMASPIGLAGTN